MPNPFNSRSRIDLADGPATIFRLDALEAEGVAELDRLPFSIRILLENVLRHAGNGVVDESHVRAVASWRPEPDRSLEVPFMPGRVVLQDFTGVPAVVDLAARRRHISRSRLHRLEGVVVVGQQGAGVDRGDAGQECQRADDYGYPPQARCLGRVAAHLLQKTQLFGPDDESV